MSFVPLTQFQLERPNEKEKNVLHSRVVTHATHLTNSESRPKGASVGGKARMNANLCAAPSELTRQPHRKKTTTCSTCSCIEMSALQRPKTTIQSQPLGIARMRVRQSSLCTRQRTHGCQNSCPRSSWSEHGGFTQDAIQRGPHILGLRVVPRTNSPEKLWSARFGDM